MPKYVDTACWVAVAFVWLIIGHAAISPAFAQSRPIPFVRQMTVCASLTDVYDVAMKDAKSKDGADFTQPAWTAPVPLRLTPTSGCMRLSKLGASWFVTPPHIQRDTLLTPDEPRVPNSRAD
jgi:hypothetical protein